MDDDELIECIFDDEVPLGAEGLFINGVDPPGDDGGPVIVTLATDDPAHAEQLMRARYGQEVVYRVQVVARFGLLATPTPLGGRIPFESEELDRASGTVRAMKHSVGWRVTEPLRRVADAGGCGRTHSERDGARVAPAEVLASLPAMPHQRQPRSVRTGISGAAITRSVVGGIVRPTVRAGDGDD